MDFLFAGKGSSGVHMVYCIPKVSKGGVSWEGVGSYSIEQSINKGEFDYSKESFIGVINAGLGIGISYESTFDEIRLAVKKFYAS